MTITLDRNQIEELQEAARTSMEMCGKAVEAATNASEFPTEEETEMSLLASARAYSRVRWLSDTINGMLKGKEGGK